MKKNMGLTDRIIRFVIAITFGILFYSGVIYGALGILLLVFAGLFLLTSFISFCPLYALLGTNTCPAEPKE